MRLAQVTLGLVVLNIVTGAAVRLSDSGLGCPDWPDCSQHHLTAPLAGHRGIEFGNRVVVVLVVHAAGLCVVGALVRSPRRRDLVWMSTALVAGILAEAAIGGLVVYSKLNPYVVMAHFMVGMALLAAATVLVLTAGRKARAGPRRGHSDSRRLRILVGRGDLRLAWAMLGLLIVALVAGTATTGAGPHAGGKGAKRIPVPLEDMVRTHSSIVLAVVALTLLLVFRLHRNGAPDFVTRRARMLMAAMIAQGIVGYTQFFTHLPPVLVGVHVFGASVVWACAIWLLDGLYVHEMEKDVPAGALSEGEGFEREVAAV